MFKVLEALAHRTHEDTSYIITEKKILPKFNKKNVVIMGSISLSRTSLLQQIQYDDTPLEGITRKAEAMVRKFPSTITMYFAFQKDNPRISYLYFKGMPDLEPERLKNTGGNVVLIHPISMMTVNSWTWLNSKVKVLLSNLKIGYQPHYVNSIKGNIVLLKNRKLEVNDGAMGSSNMSNPHRYGFDYLYLSGEMDLDWATKKRNLLFSSSDTFQAFMNREYNTRFGFKEPGIPTTDEMVREAKRRAADAVMFEPGLDFEEEYSRYLRLFKKYKSLSLPSEEEGRRPAKITEHLEDLEYEDERV